MNTNIEKEFSETYQKCLDLGIAQQIEYDKFYIYSIITHSTAIEGSTITEEENSKIFENGVVIPSRTLMEHFMNTDLKRAYDKCFDLAKEEPIINEDFLRNLSAIVMKNTGSEYYTATGTVDSSAGDFRRFNVRAGLNGPSYMGYEKVMPKLREFCEWLNKSRKLIGKEDVLRGYRLSFDAHYNLVTIHPWADGNGRMSRLLMNFLQIERNLIPSKILKDQKEEYIEALKMTRETGDLNVFRNFMFKIHTENLKEEVKKNLQVAEKSMEQKSEMTIFEEPEEKEKSRKLRR